MDALDVVLYTRENTRRTPRWNELEIDSNYCALGKPCTGKNAKTK